MNSSDHASIDVDELADSLSSKFKTLSHPSSEECCIYKVPCPRRCLHPSDYTPQTISIGPLHHGTEELRAMEENKLRYLYYFLQRTKVSIADFLTFIKGKEARYRNCYADTIHLDSDEFVTMILTDVVFLIEFFLRNFKRDFNTDDDPLFRNSKLSFLGSQMRYDLYLIENQLPLFVLIELFDLAKTSTYRDIYDGISLMSIASIWFSRDLFFPIQERNLIESHFSQAQHFIDLAILCLHPPKSSDRTPLNHPSVPGVKDLHQAGVKFKRGSSECLLDIGFNKGILEIPLLQVTDYTERLYRNLLTFENMHVYPLKYLNDYVIIMCYFVNTSRDADLLIQNGIVMGDSERFSTVFHSLLKDCTKGIDLHYADLVKDIQAYRKSPWNRWKANLKQNYFNTPWASISVIAAVILLLLTVAQTVCALIDLRGH